MVNAKVSIESTGTASLIKDNYEIRKREKYFGGKRGMIGNGEAFKKIRRYEFGRNLATLILGATKIFIIGCYKSLII